MNDPIVLLIIFTGILGIFAYFSYSFYKSESWARRRNKVGAIFMSAVSFSLFLGGLETKDVIMTTLGISLFFASASNIAQYIKQEPLNRFLEALFTMLSIATILYGYLETKNIILGVITLFVLVMLLVGLMLSHIIPKVHKICKHSSLG